MTRFITTMLTLALITGLSCGKASAQQANAGPILAALVINTNVASVSLTDAGMTNRAEEFDQLGISESLKGRIRSFLLTAAGSWHRGYLSESETYAQANQVPVLALSLIQTAEAPLEEIGGMLHSSIENEGGSDLYQQNELEFSSRLYLFDDQQGIWNDITFNCHATPDAEGLIAIIALSQTGESGMDDITGMLHLYDTLLDMGFSAEDVDDVVIEAMSILSFEFQELTILQFNPREYTFSK